MTPGLKATAPGQSCSPGTPFGWRLSLARPACLAFLLLAWTAVPSHPASGGPSGELLGAADSRAPAYTAAAWIALGGPPGGLGYDIRFDPADFDRWYVTDDFAGIFYSDDRGLTWASSNQGLNVLGVDLGFRVADFCVTVDPHHPTIVWTGLDIVGHVYKSTDRGVTWVAKDNGLAPHSGQSFRGFTVDPRSSDTVYLASELVPDGAASGGKLPASDFARRGRVYRTSNGGESWERIWEGDALARYVWIAPDEPNRIYVSTGFFDREPMNVPSDPTPDDMGGLGILRTTDGGLSWIVLGKDRGLGHLYVGSLFMKPGDSRTLLAGAGSITTQPWRIVGNEEVPNGGAYLTTDGGDTWREVIANEHITSVEYCQQDPSIAYAASERAVYRSEDGGLTWMRFGDVDRRTWGPPGLSPGVPVDMQTDPEDCHRVFINNYVGGNFLSRDGGESWEIASRGYTGADPPRIFVDQSNDRHVWTVTRMAPWESTDGGFTWTPKAFSPLSAGGESMGVDPTDPEHVFIDSKAAIFESVDGGDSWIERHRIVCPGDLTEEQCAGTMHLCFSFAPSDPRTIFAGTVNTSILPEEMSPSPPNGLGIATSKDGGKSWSNLTHPSIARRGFRAIAVSPDDPSRIYAGGRTYGVGVLESSDGGESWTSKNEGLPEPVGSIRALVVDPSDASHLLLGGTQGLFASYDGAATWSQIAGGIEANATVNAVLFDRSNPSIVYVGTGAGVVYSTDGGRTFLPLNQGLGGKTLQVSSLALSADGSVLYASAIGTFRLGTPAAPPEPVAEGLSCGPNPFVSGTEIRYGLSREEWVELKIFDVLGNVVITLDEGVRPSGPRQAFWDGLDLNGNRAPAGIYFVRLKVGERLYRSKVVRIG